MRDRRLREVFRLEEGDRLPSVDEAALTAYYRYLAANLEFPFEAVYRPESGFLRIKGYPLTILALESSGEPWIDESCGVLCLAGRESGTVHVPLVDLDLPSEAKNRQLVADYQNWYWNGR